MSNSSVICSSVSPNGNIEAIVEQDGRVVYFYLFPCAETNFEMKSCWVRNLQPAPEQLDVEGLRKGTAPLLPRGFCRHPDASPTLCAGELRITWFEEGNAAALIQGSDVLAIIPPWSGQSGFAGYSRDCIGESPLCWQLPTNPLLFDRVRKADDFWHSWERGDSWPQIRDSMMLAYEKQLGMRSNYYALDGGKWPPNALLRIPSAESIALVTAGMCIRPQPNVEVYTDDPRPFRRIELGMCLDPRVSDQSCVAVSRYLSGQSRYPWSRYSWLGHGHTLPCDVIPPGLDGTPFPFVLLQREMVGKDNISLPDYRGDPVSLLWMIPITDGERAFAESHGSSKLARALVRAGVSRVHRSRLPVDLNLPQCPR